MKWLGNLYSWFWFHTEFWLTPVNRRPYTFIMRDWMYKHVKPAIAMVVIWYAGLAVLAHWHNHTALILGILSAMLLGHLIWGTQWIEGQQECPEYLGD